MAVSYLSTHQLSTAAHPLSNRNNYNYLKRYPKWKCVDAYYPGLRSLAPCNWTAAIQLLVAVPGCEDWGTSPVSRCRFPQFSQRWHDILISFLLRLLLLSGHWEDNTIHIPLPEQGPDRIRAYELSAVTIICPSLSWKAM